MLICEWCGKEFKQKYSIYKNLKHPLMSNDSLFCSQECLIESKRERKYLKQENSKQGTNCTWCNKLHNHLLNPPEVKKEIISERGYSKKTYLLIDTCSLRCERLKEANGLYQHISQINNPSKNKCEICGFDNVIDFHHINQNKEDNSKKNLIGLCPNHHYMIHRLGYTVLKLKEFIKK